VVWLGRLKSGEETEDFNLNKQKHVASQEHVKEMHKIYAETY
jgi:hypothetical protein